MRKYLILTLLISLLVLTNCASDGESFIATSLGIRVFSLEYVDLGKIDEIFVAKVEEEGYGPVPPFDLIIRLSQCEMDDEGVTKCGFRDSDLDFPLAGRFYPPKTLSVHLRYGLEGSALSHEIRHYVMFYYDVDGWNINSYTTAMKEN